MPGCPRELKAREAIRAGHAAGFGDLLPAENLFGHTRKLRLILSALDELRQTTDRRSLRVLDFGCGNGAAVTRYLCGAGHDVLGVDFHGDSIAYAQKRFGSPACRFQRGGWDSIGEDAVFDAVVFADVLEHVEEPGEFLRNARACLADGGRVLVSIPNGFGPFEIESYLSRVPFVGPLSLKLVRLPAVLAKKFLETAGFRKAGPAAIPYNEESGHIQFFTRSRILSLFHEAGLRLRRSEKLSFICGPYSNSLLGRWGSACRWNAQVATYLPAGLVSAWLFELEKVNG